MNIAVFTHYFTPEVSAPSIRIHDMARQWIDLGHRVQIVTCFPNHPTGTLYPGYRGALYHHEVLDGIDVHRHWTYRTPNRGFVRKSLGHLSYLPSALLITSPRLERPDVVIGSSPTFLAAEAAARAARSHRVPFVMEVRDLWPAVFTELGVMSNRTVSHWLERVELGLYRRATRVVTVTESFRKNLLSRNVPSGKVVTIPNGADLDFWKPREPPLGFRQKTGMHGAFAVLYVGTHGISHGLGAILASAVRLRHHDDIRFLFVGEGADKRRLIDQATELGLGSVRFIDSVNKELVRDYYSLADVCLVPLKNIKLFEAFIPSKIFEIMAMGRPVVGAVRGEAAEILQRSGAAIVVAPEDSAGMSEALLQLHSDPHVCRAMGESGRRFVVEHYDRRKLANAYARVLEEAVHEAPRA